VDFLSYLPHWVSGAIIPAIGVAAFFWKGDEALSDQFKQWLSERIQNLEISTPHITSIASLNRIFDRIYGPRYFGVDTFLRIGAITSLALFSLILFVSLIDQPTLELFKGFFQPPVVAAVTILINLVFDIASVTKARMIINYIDSKKLPYPEILVLLIDVPATGLLLWAYFYVFLYSLTSVDPSQSALGPILQVLIGLYAFMTTTFLTTILIVIFCVSISFLRGASYIGSFRIVRWLVPNNIILFLRWILPVQTLPVRSIGVAAGALVFLAALVINLI
jgi:hypothetical protein